MTVGFKKLRYGHAAGRSHEHRKRDLCTSGGFYKSPSSGQTIASTTPVNITWDTSCMDTTAVDIYLYAPTLASPRIHEWQNVDFANGYYNATINPAWYNATSSMQLQLTIVASGTPVFMSNMPAAPVWTLTYSGSSSGASTDLGSAGAMVENVNNVPQSTGISKGAKAAAVLLPLLLIIGLCTYFWIRRKRAKGKDKRKRFSEAIDKRMSTISTEWKPVSVAGATAAIRNSIAVSGGSGNRNSSFSFGDIRPSSETTAVDSAIDFSAPHMAHIRPGIRASTATERVSRISFAPDTRPASEHESRRTRAFHQGFVPPLPSKNEGVDELSPTQTTGPLSLTADDIRDHMAGRESTARPSMDEMMPALSMMRTGSLDGTSDELMFAEPMPTPPAPTYAAPKSSVVGMMPMQPMPANMMSPDDMLRAYAERRAVGSPPATGSPAFPMPAVSYNGNGMRTLYSPETPSPVSMPVPMLNVPLPTPPSPESLYPNSPEVFVGGFRKSVVPTVNTDDSRFADEDYDGETGTAE